MTFDKILNLIENTVIAVTFLVLTVLAFANVVARYVLQSSLSWSMEIVVGLAVYMIMVGMSAAIRSGSHPNFSVLLDAARGTLRTIVVVLIGVAMAGFLVMLLVISFELVATQFASGRATPALGVPQWVLTFALPLGAAFGIIRSVQLTVERLRRPERLAAEPKLLPGG